MEIDVIGLDMDGVIVDLAGYQLAKGIPYFSKKLGLSKKNVVKNLSAYDIEEIFGVSHSERMKFWAHYIWQYCLTIPPIKGVSEKTNKWHNEGRKVVIVTSRVYVMEDNLLGELFRLMVHLYLKINNIYVDDVIFCEEKNSAEAKAKACRKAGIKLMIDDKLENVNKISEERLALCFDNPWNQEGLSERVTRIDSFEDADKFIQNYEFMKNRYTKLPRGAVRNG